MVVLSIIKIKQALSLGSYLGLPSSIGRDKIFLFFYIEDELSSEFKVGKISFSPKLEEKFLLSLL